MGGAGASVPRLLMLLALCLLCNASGSGVRKRPAPSATVVGAVYCDTCFRRALPTTSHFVSGAVVAVECGGARRSASFRTEARTDERGVFRVRLPPSIGKHLKSIRACSVKLVTSGEPLCAVAASATSSFLRLRSTRQGRHVFSAGFFTFKPLQQPELCYQKPSPDETSRLGSVETAGPLPTPALLPQFPPPPLLPSLPVSPSLGSLAPPTETEARSSFSAPPSGQKPSLLPRSPPIPSAGGGSPGLPTNPPSVLPVDPFQPPPRAVQPGASFPPPPPSSNTPLTSPTAAASPAQLPAFPFPSFLFPPSPILPGHPPAVPSAP